MKLTKRIKLFRALPTRKGYFVREKSLFKPFGYYRNRPNIKNPYLQTEIGRYDNFRFIISETIS